MAQEEKYNKRDRSYSAWHRRKSTARFVGIEIAQLLALIDLDAALYVEYDNKHKMPLALIETARDVDQDYKNATVTTNLARMANIPALIVLYRLSNRQNPADERWKDIEWFRVKRTYPLPETNWKILSPERWARLLVILRRSSAQMLDALEGYNTMVIHYGQLIQEHDNGSAYLTEQEVLP